MHKSELEGMTLAELTALAGKLGAELSNDQTTLIYNILDAQSLQAPVDSAPKKRGRKPKATKETEAQPAEAVTTQPEAKLDDRRGSQQAEEAKAVEQKQEPHVTEQAAPTQTVPVQEPARQESEETDGKSVHTILFRGTKEQMNKVLSYIKYVGADYQVR